MFTYIRRFKYIIVGLMLVLTLAFSYRAYSQSLPNPGSAFSALPSALATAAAAWGTASLIVSSGGVTTIATATAGTFLGLTPVGWAAIGLAVLGSVLITADTESPTGSTAVVVSGSSIVNDPNPDIPSGGSQTVSVSSPVLFQITKAGGLSYSNLWFNRAECLDGTNKCTGQPGYDDKTSPTWREFQTRLVEYLRTTYGAQIQYAYAVGATSSSVECNTSSASPYYAGAGQICVRVVGSLGRLNLADNFNWSQTTNPAHATFRTISGTPENCDPDASYYDYALASCILKQPQTKTLRDGVCNISFASNGTPVFNPFDPDCVRAKQQLQLVVKSGTADTPPSVSVTDPTTGKQVITERPVNISQGGQPGSVTVRERTPDPGNNTTIEKVTTTAPAPVSPNNPTAAPVSSGAGQQIYPGIGVVSPTPLPGVTVGNWPSTMNVTGTVNCANCTPAPLELPDKFKIDGEVPADYTDLPVAPELAEASSVLDPLKSRFASIMGFQFPTHSTRCPSISIDVAPAGVRLTASSNFMCETLEDNRTLFTGLAKFGYLIAAIIIVLGA